MGRCIPMPSTETVTRENIAQAIKARQIRKALDQAKADDTPLEQVEIDDE